MFRVQQAEDEFCKTSLTGSTPQQGAQGIKPDD